MCKTRSNESGLYLSDGHAQIAGLAAHIDAGLINGLCQHLFEISVSYIGVDRHLGELWLSRVLITFTLMSQ